MFEQINKELEELQQRVFKYRRADTLLKQLRSQLKEQQDRLLLLELELEKENHDVEKISKMSLSSVFYTILGSREKQVEKERQEALAAQLKYEDMKRQSADTQRQISALQSEKIELKDSESKYNALFQKKYELLKQSDSVNSHQIMELENKISLSKANLKEISEAISSGYSVKSSLSNVEQSLDSAENWGAWDMWGGGGLITNLVKHGHIDDARDRASEVQMLLNRFRTELADVKISSQITIDIGGFTKFADFFFDGLISDWVVQSRIHDSQDSVDRVRDQVSSVLRKLEKMQDNDKAELNKLENELSVHISNA